ncbi:hypothetical protein [Psychrobacillus vulpis]|nr:hypothetical protein [Psychrobacillus vulpis]
MVVERVFYEDDLILLEDLLTSFVEDQIEQEIGKFIKNTTILNGRDVA